MASAVEGDDDDVVVVVVGIGGIVEVDSVVEVASTHRNFIGEYPDF